MWRTGLRQSANVFSTNFSSNSFYPAKETHYTVVMRECADVSTVERGCEECECGGDGVRDVSGGRQGFFWGGGLEDVLPLEISSSLNGALSHTLQSPPPPP